MGVFTRDDSKVIALACREYIDAYEKRNPSYAYMTLREQTAYSALLSVLALAQREAVSPNIGTAA